MLGAINISDVQQLFDETPTARPQATRHCDNPGMSEIEITHFIEAMADILEENRTEPEPLNNAPFTRKLYPSPFKMRDL